MSFSCCAANERNTIYHFASIPQGKCAVVRRVLGFDATGDGGTSATTRGPVRIVRRPISGYSANRFRDRIYFDRVHLACPMIHKPRFMAAVNLSPMARPPIALRYMMWCLAASLSDRYAALAPEFYKRARKYADSDEMRGSGEQMLTIGHCQMWALCAWYEFKHMYFPRAWVSTGTAVSLALMLGLNRVDGGGLDVKQCLPPPKDWTEREERRRTFWMVFCADRYASIGTGWAHRLDERDIMTMLPASEDAYEKSRPQPTVSLEQAFSNAANSNISAISGVIMITCLLGRNLIHLHRQSPHDNEKDLNGLFWQRHRQLENLLTNVMLHLPDHLRVPAGLPDGNVIFLNMLLQTSVICLHQAAIFKADKNGLPARLIDDSREACLTSAREISRTMKMIIHLDLASVRYSSTHSSFDVLTFTDQSIHIFLSLRCRPCLCPIPQISTRRYSSYSSSAIPRLCNASTRSKESTHHVIHRSIGG
jgi:hypothetical protein